MEPRGLWNAASPTQCGWTGGRLENGDGTVTMSRKKVSQHNQTARQSAAVCSTRPLINAVYSGYCVQKNQLIRESIAPVEWFLKMGRENDR